MFVKDEGSEHINHQCSHYFVTMNANETITFCNSNFGNKFLNDNHAQPAITHLLSKSDLQSFRNDFSCCVSLPGKCVQGTSKIKNNEDKHHFIKWEMVADIKPNNDINVHLVAHDIFEPHDSIKEIEQSRRILKSIFDSTENVKFFISPSYIVQFFNKKAYENGVQLHGRKMKIGDNILDFVRDVDNNIDEQFIADFNRTLNGETVVSETEIIYTKELKRWFRSEYYPVFDNSVLTGVSVTVSDITDRNNYEENIRLQNEKLRKIAFIQSHQVRQPLSNILGILSFINTQGLSDDDQYLMKILNLSAKQLDSVIRNIVIEAQQIKQLTEPYDPQPNL